MCCCVMAQRWTNLFSSYTPYTHRTFRSCIGVAPEVCEHVWLKYGDQYPLRKPKYLLWTLNFLKCYDVHDHNPLAWGVSERHHRRVLWPVLEHLNTNMNEVCLLLLLIVVVVYYNSLLQLVYRN